MFRDIKKNDSNNSIDIILKKTKTLDGYNFLRKCDFIYNPFIKSSKLSKYIIWASDFHIKRMIQNKNFYIDATFIKPNQYTQTLILMFFDEKTEIFIPGLFILMNTKLEEVYSDILKYINVELLQKNINNNGVNFTCDFETAIIKSIRNVFKNARIIGCYFHYKQSLLRNAKKLGYSKKEYKYTILEIINNKLGLLPYIYDGAKKKS